MAAIIRNLLESRINGTNAEKLLAMMFAGDLREVDTIIQEENLGFQSLTQEAYMLMAQKVIDENAEIVQHIQQKGKHGKMQWLIGQMMRQGKGRIDANRAGAVLKEILGFGQSNVTGKEMGKGEGRR